jgi:hypothetical protein
MPPEVTTDDARHAYACHVPVDAGAATATRSGAA